MNFQVSGFGAAIAAIQMPVSASAPDWIELMPAGKIVPRDGREPWVNDAPEMAVTASRARAVEAVVDYDHQTHFVAQNGLASPAAGWIEDFQVRAGAIWGLVDWTPRGRSSLASREFRYISPEFTFTKSGRRVTSIVRAALTNNPALELPALASAGTLSETEIAVARKLGLDPDAFRAERNRQIALARLKETRAGLSEEEFKIAQAFGLDPHQVRVERDRLGRDGGRW